MFLPMSCTSPFTVASSTRPLVCATAEASRSASMYGIRCATAFFITRALFTTCGRNILPGAEQVADDVHAGHERALDHLDRALDQAPGLLGVLHDVVRDPFDQRVGQPLAAPAPRARPRSAACAAELALDLVGDGQQPVGGVGPAVEDHVLHPLEQVGRNVGVDRELPGVHDPHVHAGLDGVVEEHRVDRLADRVVAAEGERHVADPAAHEHVRQRRLDAAGGLDVVHRVVVVLLDARCRWRRCSGRR